MISNVVLKIGQLSESPFAIRYTAFKRTDTSMNPQMGVQVRLLLECCRGIRNRKRDELYEGLSDLSYESVVSRYKLFQNFEPFSQNEQTCFRFMERGWATEMAGSGS